jgi:hypothetical protein
MSSEYIDINQLKTSTIDSKAIKNKVNINLLMAKVRNEEKKQKKESFVILSLIGSVVLATGIIASL